jgi:hypothetical protein
LANSLGQVQRVSARANTGLHNGNASVSVLLAAKSFVVANAILIVKTIETPRGATLHYIHFRHKNLSSRRALQRRQMPLKRWSASAV